MLGKDFQKLKADVRKIPEVAEYLDSFSVSIGNTVFARRMQLGLTQSELAKQAGTTQARISMLEAGSDAITADVYNRVFRALRLEPYQLFFNEESATAE